MTTSNTVLITGAARRLGKAIALGVARRGWDVVLHYGAAEADARATAAEIRQLGRRCEVVRADLGDAAEVRELIGRAREAMGPLSLLVNNAAIFERGEFLQTEEDFFDRHFDVNFRAPFLLSRDFARQCDGPGHIINLVDAAHTHTGGAYFAYTLTKKLLAEFTQMAARSLGPRIRVNGICPGPVLPPPGGTDAGLQHVADKTPLRRTGDVADIAAAAEFLLDNTYVTGLLLYVDGGQHIA
ncbi:MAG: SDR family oxidoreductase [Phycisphaerae bacterium]|nr:SDR family oxidoreductase [Phycisphaerae bacterium]